MPTRTSSRLDNAETLESTTLPPPPFAAKELPSVVHRSPDTCSRASTNLRKYVMADASCGIRKPRKSRGRGLRATTGCLVCKRRHVKCDEVRPQCGPCAKGQRPCVYSSSDTRSQRIDASSSEGTIERVTSPRSQIHEPLRALVDACHQEQPVRHPTDASQKSFTKPPGLSSARAVARHGQGVSPLSPEYAPSPGTESSSASTRLAPLSWFELLANDAANADRDFLLSPPQRIPPSVAVESSITLPQSPVLQPHNQRERESFQAASFRKDPEIDERLAAAPVEDAPATLPDEYSSWSTATPIELSDQGHFMFNHFVRTLSVWMDFFDPTLQLSTTLPHLALRNIGLMKALLALSARHLSLHSETNQCQHSGTAAAKANPFDIADSEKEVASTVNRNVAVQYYYETLQYLNKAMHYPSYARSAELLCTALLISTYEMIDGSNYDWERHLKGVFWIQRFQNNNGESGGVRQGVWWAWLRQDVWVAMRERRRVFSFFQPRKQYSMLDAAELTCRAYYLLSQCVNYASREESETTDIQQRLERGNELLFMLQEWQDYLPREFRPLPLKQTAEVFPPIWIHPSPYAAAVQLHSLARILVVLHRPSIGGLQDYRAAQRLLAASVGSVCGIARMVKENDIPASLVSLNCLFGAGMSVHAPHERSALLDLIETFQRRVRWPADSLRKELESEYQKDELSAFAG